MSITATGSSNYMSNEEILGWMQQKTDGIYGHMREAMDTSNTRAHAEDALNAIKAKILEAKTNGGDAAEIQDAIREALKNYKDVPEVAEVLGPFARDLADGYAKSQADADNYHRQADGLESSAVAALSPIIKMQIEWLGGQAPAPVTLSSDQADNWSKAITDKVDNLGKQDQLGLINIQEFNAQLNQAKQTASALMDAADKSANAIIGHIS